MYFISKPSLIRPKPFTLIYKYIDFLITGTFNQKLQLLDGKVQAALAGKSQLYKECIEVLLQSGSTKIERAQTLLGR